MPDNISRYYMFGSDVAIAGRECLARDYERENEPGPSEDIYDHGR